MPGSFIALPSALGQHAGEGSPVKCVESDAILYKGSRSSAFGSISYSICTRTSAGKGNWVSLDFLIIPRSQR